MVKELLNKLLGRKSLNRLSLISSVDEFGTGGYYGTIFSCIDIWGKYFAKANFRLYYRDDNANQEVKNHNILLLFRNPNKYQTFWEIKYRIAHHLAIYGNCYIYKLRDNKGNIIELHQLNPHYVIPIQTNNISNPISHYEYYTMEGVKKLPINDVIHIRYPDGDNPYVGKSIISNIMPLMEIEAFQLLYQKKFYKEGGFMGLTFVTNDELSQQSFDRLKQELEKRYGGSANAYKVAVLEKVQPVKSAYSMRDMDLTNIRPLTREEIMSAFQIPKILMGMGESINRNTAEASIFQFTSGVIDPLLDYIDDALTKYLASEYSKTLFIEHDIIAPKDIEANINYYKEGLNSGWLTLNRVNEMEGLGKFDFPEADEPIIAVNRMPISYLYNASWEHLSNNVNTDDKSLKDTTIIQSILFDKEKFTLEEAKKWLEKHNFKNEKVDETDKYYRFRQREPDEFIPDSFRTIEITDGIKAIVGRLKEGQKGILEFIKFRHNLVI